MEDQTREFTKSEVQQAAQQQAATLQPLTPGMLQRVLKALPDRASGPDAVSTQMLKSIPPLALTPLLQLFQSMETTAELPTQLQMHLVVMLPKNQRLERPITLTSTLWRVWRRLEEATPGQMATAAPAEHEP